MKPVDPAVATARAAQLREEGAVLAESVMREFIGMNAEVLVERRSFSPETADTNSRVLTLQGTSARAFHVVWDGDAKPGALEDVRLETLEEGSFHGTILRRAIRHISA